MPSPPVVPPQMEPETHGFAPTLRAGAPLLWTFAWETPLGEAGQAQLKNRTKMHPCTQGAGARMYVCETDAYFWGFM